MDLWCSESSSPVQQQQQEQLSPAETQQPDGIIALADQHLLNDSRVLQKLLLTELRCRPQKPELVYDSVQKEVRPHMRKILTTWMLEVSKMTKFYLHIFFSWGQLVALQVCEELNCEAIFPLAVNYVDRFLSNSTVSKSQLQLLGAVCLLIASKLRQCRSIHPQDLVYFSDYTYTISDVTVSIAFNQSLNNKLIHKMFFLFILTFCHAGVGNAIAYDTQVGCVSSRVHGFYRASYRSHPLVYWWPVSDIRWICGNYWSNQAICERYMFTLLQR